MNHLEEATWREAMTGDGEAFGRVFDAHRTRVYRHALKITGHAHDAEEILAGAFLELWRRRSDVRVVDGSVLPWLLVTANNLALNHGRSRRRHHAFIAKLPRREQVAASADEEAMIRAELDVDPRLLEAIAQLGDTDRRLLALVALEDQPLKVAAEVLGLTEAAARSRWQRVRTRLAAAYPRHLVPLER